MCEYDLIYTLVSEKGTSSSLTTERVYISVLWRTEVDVRWRKVTLSRSCFRTVTMKARTCIFAAIFFGQISKLEGTLKRGYFFLFGKTIIKYVRAIHHINTHLFFFPPGFLSDDEDLLTEGPDSRSGSGDGCFQIPTDRNCTVSFRMRMRALSTEILHSISIE